MDVSCGLQIKPLKALAVRANPEGGRLSMRLCPTGHYGSEVRDCWRVIKTSLESMRPLVSTSARKLDGLAVWRLSCRTRKVSVESTRPLPSTSARSTLIGTETLPLLVPSLTPSKLIESVCALLTFVRLTVTWLPLTVGAPEMDAVPPAPGVTVALVIVTGAAKVTITLWLPAIGPVRDSIPGRPLRGKSTLKSPALPCVLRDTALTGTIWPDEQV